MSGAVVEITRTTDEETETVARAVYEHPLPVRLCHWVNAISLFVMVGSGLQIFRAFPSFGAKIPQKDLLNWPKVVRHRRMAGRCAAVAFDVHVDLHRDRGDLSRVSDFQRQLSAGVVYASRYSRRVADGEALFLFRAEAALREAYNPLQKQAYTTCDRAGRVVGADRAGGVEAGAVFVAGVADGRISLGAAVAFSDDVGDFGVCVRASGDGDAAWLE